MQEEADHLALAVGLDLLARDHDQVVAARELDRLERAAEDVVIGDGDRAETARLGVLIRSAGSTAQSCDQLVCMCRSATIHGAAAQRIASSPASRAGASRSER